MDKEIILKCDEVLDYIRNNVENYDTLELTYNRVFVPGEVLDIETDDEDSLNILIQMNGELVNDTVQIDLAEIKDDLVEIIHTKNNGESIIIVVNE